MSARPLLAIGLIAATTICSSAGEDRRADVDTTFVQPFVTYTIRTGLSVFLRY